MKFQCVPCQVVLKQASGLYWSVVHTKCERTQNLQTSQMYILAGIWNFYCCSIWKLHEHAWWHASWL